MPCSRMRFWSAVRWKKGLYLVDGRDHLVVLDEVDEPVRRKFDTPMAFAKPFRLASSNMRHAL